jgi:hypothetical protein
MIQLEAEELNEDEMYDSIQQEDEYSRPQQIGPSGYRTCADHEEVIFAT